MKTFCCIYLPGTNTGSPKDRNDYKRSNGWLYGAQRRVVRTYSPQIALKSTADIIAIPSVNPAIDSEDRYWNRRGSCYLLRRKPASELILYVGNCVRCILFAHIDAAFHLQAFVRISPYRLHGCGSGIPLLCISCARSSTAVAATSVSLTGQIVKLSAPSPCRPRWLSCIPGPSSPCRRSAPLYVGPPRLLPC